MNLNCNICFIKWCKYKKKNYLLMNINGELSLIIFRYCNRNYIVRIYLYFYFKLLIIFIIIFEIIIRNECILYIYFNNNWLR